MNAHPKCSRGDNDLYTAITPAIMIQFSLFHIQGGMVRGYLNAFRIREYFVQVFYQRVTILNGKTIKCPISL